MRLGAAVLVMVAIVCVTARAARAFPQLALREGETRCNACHVGPAGTGLINDYGRDEAADALSRGGDGRLLHGSVTTPDWLTFGGDFRAAALASDVGGTEGRKVAAFPMQADLRVRIGAGAWSFVATGGLRGSARQYRRSAWSYLASAEHYVLWQRAPVGWYARLGRFMPPMGLRLPDHTLYVRRYTGTNLLEEPYALGVGYLRDEWELHATAFVHDPLVDVGRDERGAVVYAERHRETSALGASARLGVGPEATRVLGGMVARHYFAGPDVVLLAEENLIHERVSGSVPTSRTQIATYAAVDWRPTLGLNLAAWYEHFHEALGQAGLSHDGVGAEVRWYPRAHWEAILSGRWQLIGTSDEARLAMFQLHYYL